MNEQPRDLNPSCEECGLDHEGVCADGIYHMIINRDGDGADVDGQADPLVKEPNE